MKKISCFILSGVFLFSSAGAFAITADEKALAQREVERAFVLTEAPRADLAPPKDPTGLEWLQMSIGQRMDSIVLAMAVLAKHGVELRGTPNDYYNAVEDKVRKDPDLYGRNISSILAFYVYETDPASRKVLDQFKQK